MRSPLILDMAIHTFDSARYVSGLDPVAVYCDEFNPNWSWYSGDASATAIFEMSGGARYTYRGSWCAEGASTSWEAEWRIAGEYGTAIWNGRGDQAPYAEIVGEEAKFMRESSRITSTIDSQPTGIAGSLRDFLHALDTGETPMGECHDNIKSLAMVFAAMESSDAKQRVEVKY
jgi:predicted dehydrogenase